MSLVLDNSVVMCWCFGEQAKKRDWDLLDRIRRETALAPGVFPLELTNALVVAERRRQLTRADAERFLQLVRALPIRIEQELPERQWSEILFLARQYALSSYDASYLDLAMRAGLPLATNDQPLRKAAVKAHVRLL